MMRVILLVLMLVSAAAPVAAQETTPASVLDAAVNRVVRPNMDAFSSEAAALEQAMVALCATPNTAAMDQAVQQFGTTAKAYGRVELIRLGPVTEDNRLDRLLFWPDRRGIGLRQVQAILAESDESAADAATLRDKSVAVQGFGALEYVLFGTEANALATAEGAFRCSYGQAIAGNIASIADEMATEWHRAEGIALRLSQPALENADYRTETEALEALVGTLAHGAEAVRDQRLLPFLARAGEAAKPKQALFWRSDLAIPMIRADLEGLQQLFERSGVGRIGEAGAGGIDQSVAIQFDRAFAALDLVTLPIEQAVADPAQAAALEDVVSATQMLQVLIGDQLAVALDLSVGFSSLDGD